MRKSRIAACIAVAALCTDPGAAQNFPSRPIEIIVPFAPGGSTDTTARLLGQKMSETFGQPVIVNNRPGGGGIIGAAVAAKANPDGHTILAHTIAYAINAAARKNQPFDPLKAFVPIIELSTMPLMLVVHPSLPVNSVQELVALAKAKPGQLNYASSGNGTSPHLAAEMFKSMAGIDMVHIPFKGNAETSNAVLGGHVPIHFGLVPPFLAHVRSGAVRALAVTAERRIAMLPEQPTIAELGYPEFEISSWQGLFVPAGTPNEVVAKINAEVVRILALPDVRARILAEGAVPVGGTPEQLGQKLAAEIEKWKRVIEQSGAKM